ncbi:MAG: NAD(P)-binding domain-containing protein [Altererythrobacter sp.]|nr:NAD(P)-binding domain-containing protein [Altererythrobacter sp.]
MFARILLFGYGTMASAMLEGWLASGLDAGRFTVYNPRPKPVPAGVTFITELPRGRFDAVLLGVKPQKLAEVVAEVEPLAGPESVLISMLAAVDLDALATRFPRAGALARLMPNLAASIGRSPNGLVARGLADEQRESLTDLAERLGSAEWLADETQFDLVAALAGSGPGFVYRFIDALAGGAAALGLERAQAERLARQMVAGAALLAADSPYAPGELARRVASPGGTTQKGLDVLDEGAALQQLVTRCLAATRDRGRELRAGLAD